MGRKSMTAIYGWEQLGLGEAAGFSLHSNFKYNYVLTIHMCLPTCNCDSDFNYLSFHTTFHSTLRRFIWRIICLWNHVRKFGNFFLVTHNAGSSVFHEDIANRTGAHISAGFTGWGDTGVAAGVVPARIILQCNKLSYCLYINICLLAWYWMEICYRLLV